MGSRPLRVLGWAAACVGLAAVALTVSTCVDRGSDLPGRVWVADPLPDVDASLLSPARPDVRFAPGGPPAADLEAVWTIVMRGPASRREVQVQVLRPLGLLGYATLFARGVVVRQAAATYLPANDVVAAGGSSWRAMDRQERR
jgi:hypothetical protein